MTENITAKLERIIYRSLDTSFMIGAFTSSSPSKKFTATGEIHKPAEGLQYSLEGKWVDNEKYGKQFAISSYCIQEPADTDSIIAYLERHITGIGPAKAEYLADKYGKYTLQLLKNKPERISNECKGITYKLAQQISQQLQEGDKQQEVLVKLEGIFSKIKNLPKKLSHEVLNLYGLSAYDTIRNNPYVLTDMNRVGFVLADKVALSIGVKSDSKDRIRAGTIYIIEQILQTTGNVWVKPITILENLTKILVGLKDIAFTDIIDGLIKDKTLVLRRKMVTLARLDKNETVIAKKVVEFLI